MISSRDGEASSIESGVFEPYAPRPNTRYMNQKNSLSHVKHRNMPPQQLNSADSDFALSASAKQIQSRHIRYNSMNLKHSQQSGSIVAMNSN